MEAITTFEREVISALFSAKGWVDLYDLHEKYLLSPGQLVHAARKFDQLGIVEWTETRLKLSDHGRHWVLVNRSTLFLQRSPRFWAIDFDGIVREPSHPSEPYMPKIRAVRAKFFREY